MTGTGESMGPFGVGAARAWGPRVAIVHDYLAQRGGAERVALELTRAFPDAVVYTTVYDPRSTFDEFRSVDVRDVAWIRRVPWFRNDVRRAFPLLPLAVRSLGEIDADVVLCSSSGWSQGVSTTGRKLVYCHNPPRWLYQPDAYFAALPRPVRRLVSAALLPWRMWDGTRARSADVYIANSANVASRIARVYGRAADVVHPPRGLDAYGLRENVDGVPKDFYLTISRRRGYKRAHEIVRAFEGSDRYLVQVGGEPVEGENVTRLSGLTDAQLRWLYANARALIAIGDEDFGLTPVEAYAFGTPAIVLAAGGYLETAAPVATVQVNSTSPTALAAAMDELESRTWDADVIRAHGEKWSPALFHRAMQARVRELADRGGLTEKKGDGRAGRVTNRVSTSGH